MPLTSFLILDFFENIITKVNSIFKITKLKQYFTLYKQSSKIMFAGFKLVIRKRVL